MQTNAGHSAHIIFKLRSIAHTYFMSFSRKEKFLLVFLGVLACLSIGFYLKYNAKASPQYAVSFKITREEAEAKAQQFLEQQNLQTNGYKRATIFTYNQENADTYLQREVGVERTGILASDEVDLWHFSSRFFKPLQQEEYSVNFLPNGRLAGFTKVLPEDAKGATLSQKEAQKIAENFVINVAKYELANWHVIEQQSENRPNRIDHTFVFEKNSFREKDATYRIKVIVLGDSVGSYFEFLKIPENWERDWAKERSKNELAGLVANVAMFMFFIIPIFILAVKLYKKRLLRWKFALWAAAISSLITFLMFLNMYPSLVYGYDTTQSWVVYICFNLFYNLLGALTLGDNTISGGLMIFVILLVGEALYREIFPAKMALENLVKNGLRSKSLTKALFIGSFIGMIDIAFQVAYYLIGQKTGMWTPAIVPYDDIMSSMIPWIFPLFIGFTAALSEEGIFRLFGISFLKKHLKHTWLAVLIVSIIFGFVHSGYPQMPWFARGIEIALPAIVWAIVFLRYGFVASFTAHFTINAFGSALGILVLLKGNPATLIPSIFIGLLPLLLALVLWLIAWRRTGFAASEDNWTNAAVTQQLLQENTSSDVAKQQLQPNATTATVTNYGKLYQPLTAVAKLLLFFGAILGISLVLIFYRKTNPQAETKYLLTRQEISAKATEALTQKGIDSSVYSQSISMEKRSLDDTAASYIIEKADLATLRQAALETNFTGWSVRFFKPLEKEEYNIILFPNGTVYDIIHTVDERAEGAKLSSPEATTVATQYLKEHQLDISLYKIISQEETQRDFRTDYHFVFEKQTTTITEATYRLSFDVLGDEPAGLNSFVKIPEEWTREHDKMKTKDILALALIVITILIFIGIHIHEFLHQVRANKVKFEFAKKIAWVFLAIYIFNFINNFPSIFMGYDTATSFLNFFAQLSAATILARAIWWLIVVLLISFAITLWKQYFDKELLKQKSVRLAMFTDAIFIGYLMLFISYGYAAVLKAIFLRLNWLNASVISPGLLEINSSLAIFLPALGLLETMTNYVATALLLAIVCLVFYRKSGQRIWVPPIIFIGLIILLSCTQTTLPEAWLIISTGLLYIGAIFFAFYYIFRDNIFAYGVYILAGCCLSIGLPLLLQPRLILSLNGLLVIFIGLLPLFTLGYYRWKIKNEK